MRMVYGSIHSTEFPVPYSFSSQMSLEGSLIHLLSTINLQVYFPGFRVTGDGRRGTDEMGGTASRIACADCGHFRKAPIQVAFGPTPRTQGRQESQPPLAAFLLAPTAQFGQDVNGLALFRVIVGVIAVGGGVAVTDHAHSDIFRYPRVRHPGSHRVAQTVNGEVGRQAGVPASVREPSRRAALLVGRGQFGKYELALAFQAVQVRGQGAMNRHGHADTVRGRLDRLQPDRVRVDLGPAQESYVVVAQTRVDTDQDSAPVLARGRGQQPLGFVEG